MEWSGQYRKGRFLKNTGGAPQRREYDPPRLIGRVSDSDWDILKRASVKSGKTFTQWALGVLLRAAKRLLNAEGT